MTIMLTAFKASPDRGRGLARDMRVRWALEEVGQPYDVPLLTFAEMKQSAHLARSPFGQIPTFQSGDLTLFECGAIILHIAQHYPGLLPNDADTRERAIMWMIAALSTIEPVVIQREGAMLLERDKPWFADRMPLIDEPVRNRLRQLSTYLGEAEWLEGEFTAGDLMMIEVLLRPAAASFLPEFPNLAAYIERGQARPAFQRAFDAQCAVFQASQAEA